MTVPQIPTSRYIAFVISFLFWVNLTIPVPANRPLVLYSSDFPIKVFPLPLPSFVNTILSFAVAFQYPLA